MVSVKCAKINSPQKTKLLKQELIFQPLDSLKLQDDLNRTSLSDWSHNCLSLNTNKPKNLYIFPLIQSFLLLITKTIPHGV